MLKSFPSDREAPPAASEFRRVFSTGLSAAESLRDTKDDRLILRLTFLSARRVSWQSVSPSRLLPTEGRCLKRVLTLEFADESRSFLPTDNTTLGPKRESPADFRG